MIVYLGMFLAAQQTHGSALTWKNTAGVTDFDATASYTGGTFNTTAVTTFTGTEVSQPNVTASATIAGIYYTGSGYDIASTGGFTVSLNGYGTTASGTSSSSAAAIYDSGSGTNTIDAALTLAPGASGGGSGTSSSFYNTGAGSLIVNGNIGGSAINLSLRGGGIIQLGGTNTFGTASIDTAGETVVLANNSALGGGTFSINSTATLQAGGGARSIANAIVLASDITVSGSNNIDFTNSVTSSGSNSRQITVSNSGTTTISGSVYLAPDNTTARGLTVGGTTALTISGVIANNNSGNTVASTFAYNGSSTLTLKGINTYTGATSITTGTLNAAASSGAALGMTISLGINNGGTLLLGGNNQVKSTANVSFGASTGGTINTAGYNQTLGALTLNKSSTVDFGAGRSTTTSALHFADSSGATWAGGTTLSITDYSGLVFNANSGTTTGTAGDTLFFGTGIGGLSSTELAQVQFVNPAGYTGTFSAYIDGTGEVYAQVPEPATIFGAMLLAGAAGWSQRRRAA